MDTSDQDLTNRNTHLEAIFKGFDGESVVGSAKIYLKPYWKERGVSYFQEEGR